MEITLKFPKTITVIMKYFKNEFSASVYHIPSLQDQRNNKVEGRCLKESGKEAEETFLLACNLSKPSRVLFKICLKNSATVVPPPAFTDKLHSILPYMEMLVGPENISNIPRQNNFSPPNYDHIVRIN